ncbi:12114_t:CDS:2 [Gigaspora margarita]|uniref:12114_t:CDS:1 n=1 Tax=Gigaspora margarita TaxID=4874 RepID=A0ABN7VGT0_GIGMA|nr:12114_t:CDS:2 [Gigaspora margarita]
MHQNKYYDGVWECFNQNVELNNPLAKFWLGYYLLYGQYHEQKDPMKAKRPFKEAAYEHNHSDAPYRYAVSLLSDLKIVVTNETEKNILCGRAENLEVKKDEERGLNYLRVAASNQNERAITLLAKLGKID